MSEILFGQSYYLQFDPKLWEAMQPYPPLGTLYAASYLREQGYEVGLFDAMLAGSEADWEREIRRQKPRFAVLYEDNFNYLSKMCLGRMREAAYAMLKIAREQGCITIVCGSDASDHPLEFMKHGADYVLMGEGERTLGELIDRLSGRSAVPLEQILGLAHAGGINPPRPDIKDLDALPFPAWDLVDVERYRSIWLERHGYYLHEHGDHARLPVPLQLVREADLGPALQRPQPGERRGGAALAEDDLPTGPHLVRRRHPGAEARLAGKVRPGGGAAGARVPFKCLNRVDLLLREGEIEALKQAGAARCGWARNRGRRKSWMPWTRAPGWSRSTRPAGGCTRRDPGRLLPAVRLPGRDS